MGKEDGIGFVIICYMEKKDLILYKNYGYKLILKVK